MLLLARTLKKASLKWLDWEACEYCHATRLTRLLWPKRYRQLEFLNGNGCKSVTAEKKGHVLFEVIFTHRVSSCFRIFGWLAWDKARSQFTRTGKRIWGNKNYRFSTNVFYTSAIELSFFWRAQPSWLVEQQPTDFLEKSHISSKSYSTSEGSCEVQI